MTVATGILDAHDDTYTQLWCVRFEAVYGFRRRAGRRRGYISVRIGESSHMKGFVFTTFVF